MRPDEVVDLLHRCVQAMVKAFSGPFARQGRFTHALKSFLRLRGGSGPCRFTGILQQS